MKEQRQLKMNELVAALSFEHEKKRVSMVEISELAPSHYRAIHERINELEQAYREDNLQKMNEEKEKIIKLYSRAADRVSAIRRQVA